MGKMCKIGRGKLRKGPSTRIYITSTKLFLGLYVTVQCLKGLVDTWAALPLTSHM